MKRSILFCAAALLCALVGAAFATAASVTPDMLTVMAHAITLHGDVGQLLFAAGPLVYTGSASIRQLKARKSEAHGQATALLAAAEKEGRDLNAEEQATFAGHRDTITSLNAQIERAEFMANEEAGLDARGAVVVGAAARISVSENIEQDPKRGFAHFGDFARSVARVKTANVVDPRLGFNAAAPGTTSNESGGADGGFGIPPHFSTDVWRLSLGEDSLIPQTQNTELTGNSMLFPKDETTPWGGAGVQVYWQNEAAAASASKLQISSQAMVLHKMMALVPVTNELIDDGLAVGSYLATMAPERIAYKANEAILFGDGVGKPLGALASPATVIQAKDSGQATLTLSMTNISNMVSRLLVGNLKNAFWLATPDLLPYLEGLTVGNYPVFLPAQNVADSSYGMLKGRPLVLSEHASAFSSKGDLSLLSLKGYRTITKAGGIQTATSMHLYFDADATAFKFVFRLNGAPILSTPVTPPKSAQTRAHFVTLAAR